MSGEEGRNVKLRYSMGRDVSGRETREVRGEGRMGSERGERAVTGEERLSQEERRGGGGVQKGQVEGARMTGEEDKRGGNVGRDNRMSQEEERWDRK